MTTTLRAIRYRVAHHLRALARLVDPTPGRATRHGRLITDPPVRLVDLEALADERERRRLHGTAADPAHVVGRLFGSPCSNPDCYSFSGHPGPCPPTKGQG